ncbi:endomucin isoform X2 [Malaclemys terrapin pileata]|uniref:endomucin isoform X2 n=1 Tax=Malaclemys terrapin pileata TaxID=2991368 RepID=UPI0023A8DD30|nr:endomucin isoform X2 [Malaclemys terrapin pileata]
MKLLGAAFLSLAVFSICTANVQENSSMTPPSKNTQWTPAQENSSMTPTSKNSQSNTVSSDSTFTIRSSTNVSAQENSSMTPPSKNIQSITTQENSSMPPTSKNSQSTTGYRPPFCRHAQENSSMTPTSKNIQSTTVSSDSTITISSSTNVSAGKTESLPGSSVMAASDSTRMTAGSHWTSTLTPSHGSPGSNDKQADNDQYSGIILPVVIALIVITLSVFILVALIRMCRRTTTEGQENGTEQATTDKEGVKLLSVKTASPETGEHSSQGKNRTHQHDESSSHLGNKYM